MYFQYIGYTTYRFEIHVFMRTAPYILVLRGYMYFNNCSLVSFIIPCDFLEHLKPPFTRGSITSTVRSILYIQKPSWNVEFIILPIISATKISLSQVVQRFRGQKLIKLQIIIKPIKLGHALVSSYSQPCTLNFISLSETVGRKTKSRKRKGTKLM